MFYISVIKKKSRWGGFFSKPTVITAITLYITVVGATYNLILRSLWKPEGLQQIVDELLHVVVPLLFIFYWLFFAPKMSLRWKDVLPWLLYPLIYVILILFRGGLSGYYPYPFIDVNLLGYIKYF
jgi:hypothetical protein